MARHDDEERLLRSVLHQNAESIFLARQRAERELERANEALELRTAELASSLAMTQATLESTADGILATEAGGRITGFNDKLAHMWVIPSYVLDTKDHRLLLDHMSRQLPDPAGFLAAVDAILADPRAESFDVLQLANGRVFECYSRRQSIEERIIGRVWSYRDVTDRARSEAALREAKEQAEAASRAKSTFLAMMSHELRTPLNAIAGYAQLMEMGIHGAVTEEQRDALLRIQSSQRHLLGLIDEVLMHAKLETGAIRYQLSQVTAREALINAEALVAPQAWAKGLVVAVASCPPDVVLHTDPEKLQQILANLLSNAVKFTERGGRVEISCGRSGADVLFFVRDTGVGIPPDELESIFEPFVQVRSELTRTAQGTGLGLSISRALAHGLGGKLTVQSDLGSGSTFVLVLPEA
ncbi:hypothetical protein BH23GEM9_BH23GEM9_29970 [soil metagenome]